MDKKIFIFITIVIVIVVLLISFFLILKLKKQNTFKPLTTGKINENDMTRLFNKAFKTNVILKKIFDVSDYTGTMLSPNISNPNTGIANKPISTTLIPTPLPTSTKHIYLEGDILYSFDNPKIKVLDTNPLFPNDPNKKLLSVDYEFTKAGDKLIPSPYNVYNLTEDDGCKKYGTGISCFSDIYTV